LASIRRGKLLISTLFRRCVTNERPIARLELAHVQVKVTPVRAKTMRQGKSQPNSRFLCTKKLLQRLIGPNGAGKSTLIKMMTTLLSPSSGQATVAGFDLVEQPQKVRAHIGYVPQLLSADRALTGYENLLLSARLYPARRATDADRRRPEDDGPG
jgi:ABC-type Mn2+/Zn2+ transport system ATPase subunit